MMTADDLARINRNLASALYRERSGALTGRNANASPVRGHLERGRAIVSHLAINNDHLSEEEFAACFGRVIDRFWTLERRALGMNE